MEKSRPAKKGGAQREREKRSAELEKAGKDPRQQKLHFFTAPAPVAAFAAPSTSHASEPSVSAASELAASADADSDEWVKANGAEHAVELDVEVDVDLEMYEGYREVEQLSTSPRMELQDEQISACQMSSSPVVASLKEHVDFSLPVNCSLHQKVAFVRAHPIQPMSFNEVDYIPYVPGKIYNRQLPSGGEVHRSWLTAKVEDREIKGLYCSICIAFSRTPSNFTRGCNDFRHAYQNVERHENSQIHRESVAAFIQHKQDRGLDTLINRDLHNLRASQVQKNINVLQRVFEIVKLLGKQGIPFRSHGSNDSLYNLNDVSLNHGNFLETVKLLSNFDSVLREHLQKSVEASAGRKSALPARDGTASCGRGNLITFLSKTTVNKVIEALLVQLRANIIQRIGQKKFSIQLDSTQDVGAVNQGMLIARFVVNEKREERLLGVLEVRDSTGAGMYQLLQSFVSQHGLKMKNSVGMSFDGASSMRGEFRGLQAHIIKEVPSAVYIWCYCHILNLCIIDSCETLDASKFFALLNKLANFIGISYKRSDVWRELKSAGSGHEKLKKKLQAIGQTRWWAREKAVQRLFGEPGSLFLDTMVVLWEIANSGKFDGNVASEADSLLESLNTLKVVLVAHVFLKVFAIVGPLSRYLQTRGLDILAAYSMVQDAKKALLEIEFETIHQAATDFALSINERLAASEGANPEFQVPMELPMVYVSRKKRMPGEESVDERVQDPLQRFRVEVFRAVVDRLVTSLDERFSKNEELIKAAQFFDPRQFPRIAKNPDTISPSSLKKISELACVKEEDLREELVSFSSLYSSLVSLLSDENNGNSSSQKLSSDCEDDEPQQFAQEGDCGEGCVGYLDDTQVEDGCNSVEQPAGTMQSKEAVSGCKGTCAECIACVHKVLFRYNMSAAAYTNLFTVYEYLLILSFTQVSCERACSKLKLIKTRLRTNMAQSRLEAQILISMERDLLEEIHFDQVLHLIRQSSSLMHKLLTV